MRKPNLLLDVDGVLLDWLGGFEQYLLSTAPHLHKDFSGLTGAEDLEQLLGMSSAQMHEWIARFHMHADFSRLQPLPGATQAIRILAPWCTMSCITASGSHVTSQTSRIHNLKQVFGDVFEHIICVDRSEDKPEHLQMFDPGYWVEDQLKNALMGVRAGHESFLMDAIYNRLMNDDQVRRVVNMVEVGEIILSQSRSKHL